MSPSSARVLALAAALSLLARPGLAADAKPSPGPGDFLYAIASGPAGSPEFALAGRLAALAAMDQEGGPHGEAGPRLTPLVEPSARQALADLLTQPSTDLAILPVPLLDRAARLDRTLKRRIGFIAPLDLATVHVLARDDVAAVGDLAGRPVAVDGPDGVGAALLSALGVPARLVETLPPDPAAALRDGDVSGVVLVGDAPISGLAAIPAGAGLRLLPVPFSPALAADFVPVQVRHADAPGLVGDQAIGTVAVPTVLAVYLRAPNGERARTLWSLVVGALDHVAARGTDPAGRALGDVNWAAELPGWQRLPAMAKWLAAQRATAAPPASDRKGP